MGSSLDYVLAQLRYLGRSREVARIRLGVIVSLDRARARLQHAERRR